MQTRIRQFEGNIRSGAIWDSLPITEKNSDVVDFSQLNEMVKINQFPCMHELGRKDSLFKVTKKTVKWQIINPSIKLFINSTNLGFSELRGDAEEVRAGGMGLHAPHLHAARGQEEDRQARVQSSSLWPEYSLNLVHLPCSSCCEF